jgi:hypothetical protein
LFNAGKQFISKNHTLNFNLSDPLGVAADAVYGRPFIGTGFLLSSVSISFDGSTLMYTLQTDLNRIVASCSSYGASLTINPTNRVYYVPIRLVKTAS